MSRQLMGDIGMLEVNTREKLAGGGGGTGYLHSTVGSKHANSEALSGLVLGAEWLAASFFVIVGEPTRRSTR